ncbi:MAG: molybdopterin converting factor subunit 1 [Aestuariivirga sp.]
MRVLYFALVRQLVGRSEDTIEIPASVTTVGQLIDFLSQRDEGCAAAFADRRKLRAAVDKVHVSLDAPITGAREVAFFPPVTGG